MPRYTFYIDESGLFAPGASMALEQTGLRVVGGLLLSGSREQHAQVLAPQLARALSWWGPPFHAVDLANPHRIAARIRNAAPFSLPPELRGLRSGLRQIPSHDIGRLRAIAPRSLEEAERAGLSIRMTVHRLLQVAHQHFGEATIVLCAEHDLRGETGRYPAMLAAACEGALLCCATQSGDAATVSLVIEAGGNGAADAAVDTAAVQARLEASPDQGCGALNRRAATFEGPPLFVPKSENVPGLALADAIAYEFGPGRRQDQPWSPRECEQWSTRLLRSRVVARFGLAVDVVAVGAVRTREVLRAALKGTLSRAQAVHELRSHSSRLPAGTLRAPVECAISILSPEGGSQP